MGRSLIDLVGILQGFDAKNVDLYLHQQGLDTSTPSGRAMFQMLGVFAEFERAIIQERIMAGLARAKAEGTPLGRPATVADNAAKGQNLPEPPAPQARVFGPLHANREWASGRSRALRDKTQTLPRNATADRLSQLRARQAHPLAAPNRTGDSGRIILNAKIFRDLNVLLVMTP